MIRVLVSACLLGERVRYNGADARSASTVLDGWRRDGRIVPFCPEVAGGLSVPRPAAEIRRGDGTAVLRNEAAVVDGDGNDLTPAFLLGAHQALEAARRANAQLAVLKEGSPSCATGSLHNGTFSGTQTPGQGVTAALLAREGIRVFSDAQWEEAACYLETLERER